MDVLKIENIDNSELQKLTVDILGSRIFNSIIVCKDIHLFKFGDTVFPKSYLIKIDCNVFFAIIFIDKRNAVICNPAYNFVEIPEEIILWVTETLSFQLYEVVGFYCKDISFMYHACIYFIGMMSFDCFLGDFSKCKPDCKTLYNNITTAKKMLFPNVSIHQHYDNICDYLKTTCPKYFNKM